MGFWWVHRQVTFHGPTEHFTASRRVFKETMTITTLGHKNHFD